MNKKYGLIAIGVVIVILVIALIVAGVTKDNESVTAVVKVTDDKKGALHASVSYTKGSDGQASSSFTFKNTYTTEKTDPVSITAAKSVTALNGNTYTMKGGDFVFEIVPDKDNPAGDPIVKSETTNDKDGNIKSLTPKQVADLLGHTTSEITELYYVKRDMKLLNGITDVLNITMDISSNIDH